MLVLDFKVFLAVSNVTRSSENCFNFYGSIPQRKQVAYWCRRAGFFLWVARPCQCMQGLTICTLVAYNWNMLAGFYSLQPKFVQTICANLVSNAFFCRGLVFVPCQHCVQFASKRCAVVTTSCYKPFLRTAYNVEIMVNKEAKFENTNSIKVVLRFACGFNFGKAMTYTSK